MDPISQGALGAVAAQCVARRGQTATAGLLGALAGMAPDLDVLIQSQRDPLLFLEFHRQFTHAIAFIPVGALACALVLFPLVRRRVTGGEAWLYCAVGFATHGVLDACTSYGTQLWWPFSDARFAWSIVSIVDPLFTVPLVLLAVVAARRERAVIARAALAWAVFYLLVGTVQRERAESAGLEHARQRGHAPVAVQAKPAFGSLLLWKTIYEHAGRFHVDAVRIALDVRHFEGDYVDRLVIERDLPWLDPRSQQALSLERFRRFSADSLGLDPERPDIVIDVRYSMLPNRIDPLWGIQLDRDAGHADHPRFVTFRTLSPADRRAFFAMLAFGDSSQNE
jgi:inner membrane protein